jgi:hypothetical protein
MKQVNKKRSESMKKKWQDKDYREQMLKKQAEIGYRAYGSRFTYSKTV